MKIQSLASSLLFSSVVLADSFLLSDKASNLLDALQTYAEIQSKSYAATNPDDYAVPSTSLFQTDSVDKYSLAHVIDNVSTLNITAGLYLNNEINELVIALTSDAETSQYFNNETSQLVEYESATVGNYTHYKRDFGSALVHSGALDSFQEVWKQLEPVISDLIKKIPGLDLTVLGHSIAGPIAGLSGLQLAQSGYNTKVLTYGSPKFGDAGLSQLIDNVFDNNGTFQKLSQGVLAGFIRHTHDYDVVTTLPSEKMYAPHGLKVFLGSGQFPVQAEHVAVCAPGSVSCDGLEVLNPPSALFALTAFTHLFNSHISYFTYQIPVMSKISSIISQSPLLEALGDSDSSLLKRDNQGFWPTNLPFSLPTGTGFPFTLPTNLPFPFPIGTGLPFALPTNLPFPFPTGTGLPFALPSNLPFPFPTNGIKPPTPQQLQILSNILAFAVVNGINFFKDIGPFVQTCLMEENVGIGCFQMVSSRIFGFFSLIANIIVKTGL